MAEFAVALEGKHLGEPGTPETLRHHLTQLPAADVIQVATKIMSVLEDRKQPNFLLRQFGFLELFPGEDAKTVDRLLSATSGSGGIDAVFFQGQLLTLMKLATSLCASGPLVGTLDASQMRHFLLAAVQINDVRDTAPGIAPTIHEGDTLEGVIWSFRNAEQNRQIDVMSATGRAVKLWLQPSRQWPSGVQTPEEFSRERFGVSLSRFVAIASAPAFHKMGADFHDPASVLFVPEPFFATTQIEFETTGPIIEALTFEPVADDPLAKEATYWSLADIADRPYFRCGTEVMTASSLRYGLERATTGIFWMLHRAFEGKVGDLTEHFGYLFENYCLNVANGMASERVTVSGELVYGPKARQVRSSDVLISTLSTRGIRAHVFVECRAGRPRLAVFESGSRTDFQYYLDDIAKKLGQLDQRIRDHMTGLFAIPDDPAGVGDTYVPVLVLDEPFEWTQALGRLLDNVIRDRRLFRAQNVVQKVIVCGVTEFEYLTGACERGADLLDLLLGYLETDRAKSLEEYVFQQTGPLRVPSFTEEGWQSWTELMRFELFGVVAGAAAEQAPLG